MKEYLLLFLFLFFPFIVNAETCDSNSITIKSVESVNTTGNASEKTNSKINNKNIELDLSMNHVEDSITYKVTIQNNSKEDYEINNNIDSKSNYMKYSLVDSNSNIVKSKSTRDFYIKAEYKNEVPTTLLNSGVFNENDDMVVSLSTLTNPKTGYVVTTILLIIGITGFICYLILNKSFKPQTLTIVVGLLLIIPSFLYADCKININIKFNVEFSKIAMFDTGVALNYKMRGLADQFYYIESFERSNTLPNEIKTLVENQIEAAKNITVSEEEINHELENIEINDIYRGFFIEKKDGNFSYWCKDESSCYTYQELANYMIGQTPYYIGIKDNKKVYLAFNYDSNKIEYVNEEKTREIIYDILYSDKENEILKNVFSSNKSDYLIYGWYDSNKMYYYCEKDVVYLNKNSAHMFYDYINLKTVPGIENANTSKVTNMNSMFYSAGGYSGIEYDLSHWDTSNVRDMGQLFMYTGTWDAYLWSIGDISNWNTSNVINMNSMFVSAGCYIDTWTPGDISKWDVSNVVDMSHMFYASGDTANTWTVGNIGLWDVSNVRDMNNMFYSVRNVNFDLSNWNTSNVINMSEMFHSACSTETLTLDISKWDVSKVKDMSYMFYQFGSNLLEFSLDISNWKTTSLENMNGMFLAVSLKYNDPNDIFNIDLSKWDVSKVKYMSETFGSTGGAASTWSVGDLSNWDTSNVEDMSSMFQSAGMNANSFNTGNLKNWNTSKVTTMRSMFGGAGSKATTWSVGNLSAWNVSNVKDFYCMFSETGRNVETFTLGNLKDWNTSSVTNMSSMFYFAGENSTTWSVGDLSNWNVSKVTTFEKMFCGTGKNATTWTIGNLKDWDTSSAINISEMFRYAGKTASTWSVGDLSDWNVSNVTKMFAVFEYTGENASTWTVGNLKDWDVSNVTIMNGLFNYTGKNATTWSVGDLSNWNTSKVIRMAAVFSSAGMNATTWSVGDLSNWDVSNVTEMNNLFSSSGMRSQTWSVGDLSRWDTRKVTNMSGMFSEAGRDSENWESIGTLNIYDAKITYLFENVRNAKATIVIRGHVTFYSNAFNYAATKSDALVTVNYSSSGNYNINEIVGTKSSSDHVEKGVLVE